MRSILISSALALSLGCPLVLVVLLGSCSDLDRAYMRRQLESIPGVRVVAETGYDDVFIWKMHADLEIEDKGPLSLEFLMSNSFSGGGPVNVASAGGLEPIYVGCGFDGHMVKSVGSPDWYLKWGKFWGSWIDVTPAGRWAGELDGGMANVQEAVERYGEIVEFLTSWPRCPETQRLEDDSGTVIYRWREGAVATCTPEIPPCFPKPGYRGATEEDVAFLERASRHLIETGQCERVSYGYRSLVESGVYSLACTGSMRLHNLRPSDLPED